MAVMVQSEITMLGIPCSVMFSGNSIETSIAINARTRALSLRLFINYKESRAWRVSSVYGLCFSGSSIDHAQSTHVMARIHEHRLCRTKRDIRLHDANQSDHEGILGLLADDLQEIGHLMASHSFWNHPIDI